jgi:phage gp36-like protein
MTAPAMADLDARYLEQMLEKMKKMKRLLASETARRKAALAQADAATARSENLLEALARSAVRTSVTGK